MIVSLYSSLCFLSLLVAIFAVFEALVDARVDVGPRRARTRRVHWTRRARRRFRVAKSLSKRYQSERRGFPFLSLDARLHRHAHTFHIVARLRPTESLRYAFYVRVNDDSREAVFVAAVRN